MDGYGTPGQLPQRPCSRTARQAAGSADDRGWYGQGIERFNNTLISACERLQVNAMSREVSLAACLESAETIHLHIKLDDTDRLACAALEAAGGVLDHGRRGFVKYRMPVRGQAPAAPVAGPHRHRRARG